MELVVNSSDNIVEAEILLHMQIACDVCIRKLCQVFAMDKIYCKLLGI